MHLPLDLATSEELPGTAPETVAELQPRMNTTWRQVVGNLRLVSAVCQGRSQLSIVTYRISGARHKRSGVVHVDHLWAAVEEGHFMCGPGGPASPPESEEDSSTDEEVAANSVGSDAVPSAAKKINGTDAVEEEMCVLSLRCPQKCHGFGAAQVYSSSVV
ncbi:hypothetical protein O3P69_012952 [Scylla paramamosain]|uniref:Uncharacterized protein n=1 Tax=Scylla paramamosain TaxID=85552 RepID=A0AAW0TSR8_SCYPA